MKCGLRKNGNSRHGGGVSLIITRHAAKQAGLKKRRDGEYLTTLQVHPVHGAKLRGWRPATT